MTDSESAKPARGKAATQERILVAATALFMEQGYEATPMIEVAERAGVSRATVFWHFGDKAALFREAFYRLVVPLRESLERDWSEVAPAKRLREQLELADQFGAEHRDALDAFVRWAMNTPQFSETVLTTLIDLNRRFAGTLADTLAELMPEGDAGAVAQGEDDPKLLAQGLVLAVDGNIILSLFDPDEAHREERRAAVAALADRILATLEKR